MGKKSRSGSGVNILAYISESLKRIFWAKIRNRMYHCLPMAVVCVLAYVSLLTPMAVVCVLAQASQLTNGSGLCLGVEKQLGSSVPQRHHFRGHWLQRQPVVSNHKYTNNILPIVRRRDPDPSIIKKNLDSYCFVTSVYIFLSLKYDVNVTSKHNKRLEGQ
jgi:hypothetical protein